MQLAHPTKQLLARHRVVADMHTRVLESEGGDGGVERRLSNDAQGARLVNTKKREGGEGWPRDGESPIKVAGLLRGGGGLDGGEEDRVGRRESWEREVRAASCRAEEQGVARARALEAAAHREITAHDR